MEIQVYFILFMIIVFLINFQRFVKYLPIILFKNHQIYFLSIESIQRFYHFIQSFFHFNQRSDHQFYIIIHKIINFNYQ